MTTSKQKIWFSLFVQSIISSLFCLSAAAQDGPPKIICTSIEECHYALNRRAIVTHGAKSFEKYDYDLAYSYHRLGAAALPTLFAFLSDREPQAWLLSGFVLDGQPGISEQHLPLLIEASSRQHAGGWLTLSIARIGNQNAIDFLFTLLSQEKSFQNQLGGAIRILGVKAVRPLVAFLSCDHGCDEPLLQTGVQGFERLGSQAVSALPDLLRIARDSTRPENVRISAVRAIGKIGKDARSAEDDLIQLETSDPLIFGEEITETLQSLGSDRAVPGLLKELRPDADRDMNLYVLREIAELGPQGEKAGPLVTTFLNSDDWDERLYAARALGYIGYLPAIDALRSTLQVKSDWRLAAVSAVSLGRLRAESAILDLENLAKTHWYAPVKKVAEKAIADIRSRTPQPKFRGNKSEFLQEFFLLENEEPSVPRCLLPAGRRAVLIAHYQDGDLMASSSGGMGSGLRFVDAQNGAETLLIEEPVVGLIRDGEEVLAFANPEASIGNSGRVYQVRRDENKKWRATPYRELPHPSENQFLLPNRDILIVIGIREFRIGQRVQENPTIDFSRGVLLTADGALRSYTCEGSRSELPDPSPQSHSAPGAWSSRER